MSDNFVHVMDITHAGHICHQFLPQRIGID